MTFFLGLLDIMSERVNQYSHSGKQFNNSVVCIESQEEHSV